MDLKFAGNILVAALIIGIILGIIAYPVWNLMPGIWLAVPVLTVIIVFIGVVIYSWMDIEK